MNAIERLQQTYFQICLGEASWNDCIEWAIQRLLKDEEGDDLDVVMLAAATSADDVEPLVLQILERYLSTDLRDAELAAGKLIVGLYEAYGTKAEDAVSLEPRLWRLFYDLDMPAWLIMLARNCEYATDMDDFLIPFEQEFEYIAGLWSIAQTKEEFLSRYDRKVSASHDAV